MVDLAPIPTEHGLCTFKPVVGGRDCPFNRQCHSCEHFVITGADYSHGKRQEERWAAMAESAPDEAARDYIYRTFEKSSTVHSLERGRSRVLYSFEAVQRWPAQRRPRT